MGGSNAGYHSGSYGPGSRNGAQSSTDNKGRFWFFGGAGLDSTGNSGLHDDLWKFDPTTNEWTFLAGSGDVNCIKGQIGCSDSRANGSTWGDSSGNLWLFGGIAYDVYGNISALPNELTKYDGSTNSWSVVIPNTTENLPVYGTLGVAAATNTPGGREYATSWIDNDGNFWLFGGLGFTANITPTGAYLNDLWEFKPAINEWVWMGGSSTIPEDQKDGAFYPGVPGVYGTLGTPAASNMPGGRSDGVGWTDPAGNLWLFGGLTYDADGNFSPLNDLWKFDPSINEWTWISGSDVDTSGGFPGVYGTLGVPAAGNTPGTRGIAGVAPQTWTDKSGNLWLFGGDGAGANVDETGFLNDLWEFNPSTSEWTGMGGSGSANEPGVYGTLGVPNALNIPGSRAASVGWTDSGGHLWLFGGNDQVNDGLDDMWIYQPASSASLSGAVTPTISQASGVYTSVLSVTISDTTPGAEIYFTTNGSTPTTSSTLYTSPITVSSSETIEAIAFAQNYFSSTAATATYTVTLQPASTPTIAPASGTYTGAQQVTISDATTGATIYYTTDGSTPTSSSTVYGGAITVSTAETIEAIAVATGFSTSAVASANYTINLPPPSFSVAGTAVSVAAGATTGNTSTITLTPASGFTGSVALTAAITTSPANAVVPPTLSFGTTSPVSISGSTAGTATLTISTTASSSSGCMGSVTPQRGAPWYVGGGAVLACMMLFGIPARRRGWRTMVGMLTLLIAFVGGLSACGSGGGGGKACAPIAMAGTTPGAYVITVTGTSGSIIETGTVQLTVQ